MTQKDWKRIGYRLFDALGYIIFAPTFIFWPVPKMHPERIKKILIIQIGSPVECVLSTPAIRALRERFAKSEIHILVQDITKDLVGNNPDCDRIYVYQKDRMRTDYNLAIVLSLGLRSCFLSFESGARYRAGFFGFGGGFFLTHRIPFARERNTRYKADRVLEVVAKVGCPAGEPTLNISVTEEGEWFAIEFFQKNRIEEKVVGLYPGGSSPNPCWGAKEFTDLAGKLTEQTGVKVIVLGTEENSACVQEISRFLSTEAFILKDLKTAQLVSMIKKCDLFIGNESAALYMASALRVPAIALICDTDGVIHYSQLRPINMRSVVICLDDGYLTSDVLKGRVIAFKDEITPENVLESAKKIINNLS